jgi:hypothetical protein
MNIKQHSISDLTDDEATALYSFVFRLLHGGEQEPAGLDIMVQWIAAHGQGLDEPVKTFALVAAFSLLCRSEHLRHEEAKIPADDVENTLRRLSVTFGEPVMPIGRYCNGLRTWQRALHDRARRKRADLYPGIDADYHKDPTVKEAAQKAWEKYNADRDVRADPFKAYVDAGKEPDDRCYALEDLKRYEDAANEVDHVFLQIGKSSLLYRILYAGEIIRETMCPTHKGRWNGQAMLMGCPDGCHGTGWLREKHAESWLFGVGFTAGVGAIPASVAIYYATVAAIPFVIVLWGATVLCLAGFWCGRRTIRRWRDQERRRIASAPEAT